MPLRCYLPAMSEATAKTKTIAIIATEESGDQIGALLAEQLEAQHPGVRLIGLGGPGMAAAGVDLMLDMLEHSATGLVEIAKSVRFFLRTMRDIVDHCVRAGADCAVLIDSPDFNLRIAPKLRARGVPVAYYVSPQVWAWRSSRVPKLKADTDELMVILPFEVDWYRKRGVEVTFVGHPLLDRLDFDSLRADGTELKREIAADAPLVGLLPGSRRNEVIRLLPNFLEAARLMRVQRPELRFAVGCAHWLTKERIAEFARDYEDLELALFHGQTHALMAGADYLLCCSGTATLEAALIGTPMLMAYQVNWLTELVARQIFKPGDLFCLPNIVMGKEVIPEMLQQAVNPQRLSLRALNEMETRLEEIRAEFGRLRELLGGPGASARAAKHVLSLADRNGT